MRLLVLGGTTEARVMAQAAQAAGADVTLSLAGLTGAGESGAGESGTAASDAPWRTRRGGFGGAEGLAQYLRAGGFAHLVDATHSFAARISASAVVAARAAGVPLLRLMRPPWPLRPGWQVVPDLPAAAAALPAGARVFLGLGGQHLDAFAARPDLWFLTRAIVPPARVLPGQVVLARPPFDLALEKALLRAHGITHMVSRNSGGAQVAAKLDAAQHLGIDVVMIARPPLPFAPEVPDVAGALAALGLIEA